MLEYGDEADCICFKIGKSHSFESVEVNRNAVVDLAKKGGVAGVEIIGGAIPFPGCSRKKSAPNQ